MKLKFAGVMFCLLLFSGPTAFAGAWDIGPFDNDDALDWVWELTDSSDLAPLDRAFDDVLRSPRYVEAPSASIAIAAAEVLAALKGSARDGLPDEVTEWIEGRKLAADGRLTEKAVDAVKLIMDDEVSELAQLWGDAPELAEDWRASLEDLLQRLTRTAAGRR